MSILNQLKKIMRGPQPWRDLQKDFEPRLVCEECNVETRTLFTVNHELNCEECKDAKIRRARFKSEEEDWENQN